MQVAETQIAQRLEAMTEINDTIDSDLITGSKADLTYKNGYTFSFGLRVAISILSVFGVFAIVSGGPGYIIGPIILFFGSYALTSTYGTDVSLSNNYVRVYSSSYGIKRGKWVPTVLMPDITVLKMGKSVGMNQIFGPGEVKLEKAVYEVYVLTANHRKRLLLCETESGKTAFETAKMLADKMEKNLVQFNPIISQRTRNMRYERH